MCEKCDAKAEQIIFGSEAGQRAMGQIGADEADLNSEVRDSVKFIDGVPFISADLAIAALAELSVVVMASENVSEAGLRCLVGARVMQGLVGRARSLAEVDALTTPVETPEPPQDTRLF